MYTWFEVTTVIKYVVHLYHVFKKIVNRTRWFYSADSGSINFVTIGDFDTRCQRDFLSVNHPIYVYLLILLYLLYLRRLEGYPLYLYCLKIYIITLFFEIRDRCRLIRASFNALRYEQSTRNRKKKTCIKNGRNTFLRNFLLSNLDVFTVLHIRADMDVTYKHLRP